MRGFYSTTITFLFFVFANGISHAAQPTAPNTQQNAATHSIGHHTPYDPQLAAFKLLANGRLVSHSIAFRIVNAEELLTLELPNSKTSTFQIFDGETALKLIANKVEWKAPKQPGQSTLTVKRLVDNATVTLQIFTSYKSHQVKGGILNGYRIGTYPSPLKGLASYAAPGGYIEVTQKNIDTFISPHFTLGQFLCKQDGGFPKYLVLRPKLLEKLEFLLDDINRQGIQTSSFVIMSGYRTPFYNHAIGNVANSRHIYGGAADIYIDVAPKDGVMDDLNKDGKTDLADAAFLFKLADHFVSKSGKKDLAGGVGQYNKTSTHGPFVHVDVRGTKARWGH